MSSEKYKSLSNSEEPWLCDQCLLFHFTDSYFEESESNLSTQSLEKEENTHSIFEELRSTRSKHINKFITAHLNINSIRNKFCEIHELLLDKIVDLLFISETKLDSTFRDGLFDIPGYKLQRRDRTSSGGGIAAFIRSDIPARRRKDLEHELIESIYFEIPQVRTTTTGKKSFRYAAPALWNTLPRKILENVQILLSLKSSFHPGMVKQCKCIACS
ncbi:uncharacterized protein LOC132745424 [Ruditapes philippinarum]|uniref:uncharacterized protein LOC132745424 n=1 Tax=Ruditapes philippinarum TaxID=129788 RepID=UPI00295AFD03|nr:uncharacterized protein LOC132745424 [Ruditapes philippinarum]